MIREVRILYGSINYVEFAFFYFGIVNKGGKFRLDDDTSGTLAFGAVLNLPY